MSCSSTGGTNFPLEIFVNFNVGYVHYVGFPGSKQAFLFYKPPDLKSNYAFSFNYLG